MNDILLIGNDVEFCGKHKGVFERSFSKKDLGEAAYILSIKIYRDRSRRLIRLLMSTYLDKILKEFKMDQSKKEFWALSIMHIIISFASNVTNELVT